jgi:hypothetical protein
MTVTDQCANKTAELVECARRGTSPGRDLRAHLAGCARCADRWENERQLTDYFDTMRMQAAALLAQDTQRESLMQSFAAFDFVRRDDARRQRKTMVRSWGLTLGAVAAVLLAVFAGQFAGKRSHPAQLRAGQGIADLYADESNNDADALSSDDFIPVPYTPPLAQGELVRVVHTDLYPEALASLGIDVDPAWAGNVAADVVVGEDGIPRAVRITDNAQN